MAPKISTFIVYTLITCAVLANFKVLGVEIVNIEIEDQLYVGKIGEDTDINLYLKKENTSPNIGYMHSLTGWFQDIKTQQKTPLAGLLSGGDMILITSKENAALDRIINFEYAENGEIRRADTRHINLQELSESLEEIHERFVLEINAKQGFQGSYHTVDREQTVSIRGRSATFGESKKYLKFSNGRYFDLANIIALPRVEFTIEAIANNEQNILLHFAYQSNLNYMGRCGAGTESGKIALQFDKNYDLSGSYKADFESCYRDIYVDDIVKVSEHQTEYTVIQPNTEDSTSFVVDYKDATIIQKTENP